MRLHYFFTSFFIFLAFSVSAQQDWKSLSDKGTEAFYANQLQTASEYYQKAIIQAEKEFGKSHPNYVTTCTDLADTYRNMGLYAQAEPLYIEARNTIDTTTKEAHPYYSINRLGLADLYRLQGKYDVSEPLYIEAKNIDEKIFGRSSLEFAISCNNLATLYQEMSSYPKAEKLFMDALKIREKLLGKKHPDYAISCNNLASLYLRQGLYEKSEPLYIEAKNIHESVLGKKHLEYANACNNLASLYRYQKRFDQSELLYIEAKNIWEITLGKNHILYALVCYNLGLQYKEQKKLSEATELFAESLKIREKVLGKNHLHYAQSCNSMGHIFQQQKRYTEAESLHLEAKKIIEKALGKMHHEYAIVCRGLANTYYIQGLHTQAEPLYQEIIQNKIHQIQVLLPTLSETERGAYLKSLDIFFKDFYAFASSYFPTKPSITSNVFNLQLITKGLIFQSTKKMQNQILQSGNQTLIKQYKDWKTKRAYLSKLSQLSLQEKEKQGITPEIEKKLANEANELEREISQVSEIFIKTLDKKVYQWKDIQQTLKKNEAVLEIIRINKDDAIHYIILAITSKTQQHPEMILLENGKELETDFINYYRNCIKFQKEDKFSYAKFFGEILEKTPSLKNKKRIYISPDGVYHQLNLLTLKNPKNNQYLTDEFNIRLISNPKDLITFAQKPQKQIRNFKEYQIHLFGYPQYLINAPSIPDSMLIDKKRSFTFKFDENSSFFTKDGKISSLPGTKIEVENIENTAKSKKVKTLVYMNQDASEDNLKKLQNPDFLHIATHGFFLGGSETEDDETRLANLENKKYVKNPLLHSGLLLAGAENTIQTSDNKTDTEDGILTADEAVSLNLDKTELVVLSACETGLGEIYNGEGVYGLQRAFQQAGAKTIIMSLWKVDDNATQEMMSLFYQNLLLKKQDKRKAFQNAQKTLKKKFPNPYYWGAFVMIGE